MEESLQHLAQKSISIPPCDHEEEFKSCMAQGTKDFLRRLVEKNHDSSLPLNILCLGSALCGGWQELSMMDSRLFSVRLSATEKR